MKNRYYKKEKDIFTTYYRISNMVGKSMTLAVYIDRSFNGSAIYNESELTDAEVITEQEYNEVAGQIYASL